MRLEPPGQHPAEPVGPGGRLLPVDLVKLGEAAIEARDPPGDRVGRLLAVVDRLEANSGVRVLDMMIVSKAQDGSVVRSSFGDDDDFGELVARLLPIGGAVPEPGGGAAAQLWGLTHALPAGTAVSFLLVEHRWAREIFDVIDEEDGAL